MKEPLDAILGRIARAEDRRAEIDRRIAPLESRRTALGWSILADRRAAVALLAEGESRTVAGRRFVRQDGRLGTYPAEAPAPPPIAPEVSAEDWAALGLWARVLADHAHRDRPTDPVRSARR